MVVDRGLHREAGVPPYKLRPSVGGALTDTSPYQALVHGGSGFQALWQPRWCKHDQYVRALLYLLLHPHAA